MGYRTVAYKGQSFYVEDKIADTLESLIVTNEDLRLQIENLTLPRLGQKEHKDDGQGYIPWIARHESYASSLPSLEEAGRLVKENCSRAPRLWDRLVEVLRDYDERSSDNSEEWNKRPEVKDLLKGKEVVRLPQLPVARIEPVEVKQQPSEVIEPLEEIEEPEDVEIIDVQQVPLGGIGKRKEADDIDLYPEDTEPTKIYRVEERPPVPYNEGLEPGNIDFHPSDSKANRAAALLIKQRLLATIPDPAKLGSNQPDFEIHLEDSEEEEAVQSDGGETIIGEVTPEKEIRRARHKRDSVLRKIGNRKPNSREKAKLKGYEDTIREAAKRKASVLPENEQATARYLLYEQATKGLSRKQAKQLEDLF